MTDRNLLLQQIQNGQRLRPTKTIDKSHPIIQTDGELVKVMKVDPVKSCIPPPPPPPPPLLPTLQLSATNQLTPRSVPRATTNGNLSSPTKTSKKIAKPNGPPNRDALMEQIKNGEFRLKKNSSTSGPKVRFETVDHVKHFDTNENIIQDRNYVSPIQKEAHSQSKKHSEMEKLDSELTFSDYKPRQSPMPAHQIKPEKIHHNHVSTVKRTESTRNVQESPRNVQETHLQENNRNGHENGHETKPNGHYSGRSSAPLSEMKYCSLNKTKINHYHEQTPSGHYHEQIRRAPDHYQGHSPRKHSNGNYQSYREISLGSVQPRLWKSQSSMAIVKPSAHQPIPIHVSFEPYLFNGFDQVKSPNEKENDTFYAHLSPPLVQDNIFYKKPKNGFKKHREKTDEFTFGKSFDHHLMADIDPISVADLKRRSQSFDDTVDVGNETNGTTSKPLSNGNKNVRVVSEYVWNRPVTTKPRPVATKEEIHRMMSAAIWHKVPSPTYHSHSNIASLKAWNAQNGTNFESSRPANGNDQEGMVPADMSMGHPAEVNMSHHDEVGHNGYNLKSIYNNLTNGTMKRVEDLRRVYENQQEYADRPKTEQPANLQYMTTTLPRVSQLRYCFESTPTTKVQRQVSIKKSPTDTKIHEIISRQKFYNGSEKRIDINGRNYFPIHSVASTDDVRATTSLAKTVHHPDVVMGRATVQTLPFNFTQSTTNAYPKQKVIVLNDDVVESTSSFEKFSAHTIDRDTFSTSDNRGNGSLNGSLNGTNRYYDERISSPPSVSTGSNSLVNGSELKRKESFNYELANLLGVPSDCIEQLRRAVDINDAQKSLNQLKQIFNKRDLS